MIFRLLWFLVLTHVATAWVLAIRHGLVARHQASETDKRRLPQPSVSILVPAWNERGTIENCIQCLRRIDYPDWEALILAGGPDGTYEAALEAAEGDPHFRLIARSPEPKNTAINRGIQASKSEIVVFLDADGLVSPKWLEELVKPLMMGASVSVGHRIAKKVTWATLAEQMEDMHAFEITAENPVYGDCSIAIWRSVLNRLGGLPTAAFGAEDWIVKVLVEETGGSVGYAGGAVLYTNRPATFSESWRNAIRNHQAHLGGLQDNYRGLLRTPRWIVGLSYYFLMDCAFACAVTATLIINCWQPSWGVSLPRVLLLAVFWFVLRHASLAFEIAAYTREISWLSRSWSIVSMYAIRCLAVIPAIVRGRLKNAYYKGPRL
ncbi:MAG: glycosyltransferase family 2 protein [Anaerolineae bacterium]|nr:glycosyltransferase family 2 protein [Anaerolineae bacterium]